MEAGVLINIENSLAASPRPFYTNRLYPSGGKLIVSNNPEEINGQGILYKDRVQGLWRVCAHHQNKTGSEPGGIHQPIQLLIVVTNPGNATQTLVVERSGVGVHSNPQIAGCQALQQFLINGVPSCQDILPGQSLSWGVSKLNFGDTFSGLYDFRVSGELEVFVVALFLDSRNFTTTSLTPFRRHRNADGSYTIRGTFPYQEVHGKFLYYAGAMWQGTQLGNNPYGSYRRDPWWDWVWSQVYRGEYPAGWSVLDGEMVYNWGNYGVFYHLEFSIEHRITQPQGTQILFNPRGGTYYGPVQIDKEILCPVEPITPLIQAMSLKKIETYAGFGERVIVSFMPAGGSSLPVRILLGGA